MAYYLMYTKRNSKTRRDEYFRIDITRSRIFPVPPTYRNGGATLREIDLFTTQFNDEKEMRKMLFKEGLISMRDFNRPLSARFYRNDKYTKVQYDFLYQKDLPYILEPKLLIDRIEKKLYIEEDYQFIIDLTNVFDDVKRYRQVSSTLPEVRGCAQMSINMGYRTRHFDELDRNFDTLLVRMIKLLIYKHTYNYDGSINYGEVDYSNFHRMLAFVNHYDKKKKEREEKETQIKFESQESISDGEQVWHQDNLFDMIAGNRLDKYVNGEVDSSRKKRIR